MCNRGVITITLLPFLDYWQTIEAPYLRKITARERKISFENSEQYRKYLQMPLYYFRTESVDRSYLQNYCA